jgi:hypothetical protein
MLEALCDHLFEKPGLYLDEMAVFIWDEFRILATTSNIRRALAFKGWSKKKSRRIAKEQNAELRELYLHNLSEFDSYQLVYVNESGCDKRIGFRRTGWSPLGVAPVQLFTFAGVYRSSVVQPGSIHIGFRAWLSDLKAAGLDLEMLGATEWYIWKNERIRREFNGDLHRVIGIAYGPRPESWYIWLSEPSDSFVGDFWALIGRPFEIMPGSWPSG